MHNKNQIENSINKLLREYSEKQSQYNLFDVLGLNYSEIHHSKFIENLINTKSSHICGDIFLQLFLSSINYDGDILNFKINQDYYNNKTKKGKYTEVYVPKKQARGSGYIDIYLKNTNGSSIIIENKIFAEDRFGQLNKYKDFDRNAKIYYLTLDGKKPNSKSTFGNDFDCNCISYKKHIIGWITQCVELYRNTENYSIDFLSSMSQYLRLLEKITYHNTLKQDIYTNVLNWRLLSDGSFPEVLEQPEYIQFKIYCLIKEEYIKLPEELKNYGSWSKLSKQIWNTNTNTIKK